MPSLIPRSGRLTLIFAAVVVALIVVMTTLLLWQFHLHEQRHADGETLGLSHIIAEQTARSLQGVDLALDIALDRIAQAERLGVSFRELPMHAMLVSRIEGMPQLRSMFIVDADGMVASSALSYPAPELSVKDRDYFVVHRQQPEFGRYVSPPVTNRVDGKRTLFFSRRILNARGAFVGVVAASLDIAHIESLYESAKIDSVGEIALYLNDGTLVARAPQDDALLAKRGLLPDAERQWTGNLPVMTVRTEGDDPGFTAYRKISGFPMVVGATTRDRDALAGWRGTARIVAAVAVANILLVLGTAFFLLRRQHRETELAAAAQESDEHVRAMVNTTLDAVVTVDGGQQVIVFNPAAERMFGYRADEVCGGPLQRLLPSRFHAVHEHNVAAFQQSGVSSRTKDARMEIVGLRKDGTEFPLESTVARVTVGGQTLFTAILRDISERRRAENDLRESHRQLRELASSLQQVREEERTSIARELHDELGQQLLRLRMDLSWLSGRLKDATPVLQDKVTEMKRFVEGTVDAVRRVTTRLRPPLLDELGLADAARWQLDEFAQRTGIEVISGIDIEDDTLGEQVAINIFRILQESLTNVARHAGATQVHVALAMSDGELALDVRDNGRGTDGSDTPSLGHGLVGIRERTLLLGGRMTLFSAQGKGFTVSVRMPLPETSTPGDTG